MKELVDNVSHYRFLIDGEWQESESDKRIEVENPANGEVFAEIQAGTPKDAVRALESAEKAQKKWAELPAVERGNILKKVAEKLLANKEELAKLLVREQGKLYVTAKGEVEVSADFISFAAESGRRIEGDIYPSDKPNEHIWIHKVPYGVCVGITAWNFPLALAARKVGPALIAGNTMVIKPTSETPLATLEFGQLALEAGVPKGVLNIITGSGSTVGKELVENPITKLVTLTGSVGAGKQVLRQSVENITAVRLELGGKAPFIVMEDANIDKAVEAALVSRFANAGQICTCNERMYLHEDIYDEFMDKFNKGVQKLKVGDPMDESTNIGPKINSTELKKIDEMVKKAAQNGCKVSVGGHVLSDGEYSKGYWYAPTVLEEAANDLEIMQEEIFGPIVPVKRISDFDEAIKLANESKYGLSAYLFTNDMKRIMRLVRELDFGEVYVNRETGELRQGFHNGYKLSGMGGEDGKYGLENYLQKKTFYVNFDNK